MAEQIERVQIEGRWYMVCCSCRYPTLPGQSWSPLYWIPQPGIPSQRSNDDKQTVCTSCYLEQWVRIYPDAKPPDLPDGRLIGHDPIPRDRRGASMISEYDLWDQAIERARASEGAETVPQAYAFIRGEGMEVEMGAAP